MDVEGVDPSRMRVSDADRHRVADVLRDAAGEGRLDLEELEERLEAAWAAKTYGDLVPLTADLQPVPPTAPVPRPAADPTAVPATASHPSSVAVMGDCKRRGSWAVPPTHTAFSLMGSVLLDLREATLTSAETVINASAIMGDVKVYVGADTRVVVDGTPIMGDYGQAKDRVAAELRADSPVVRVRGLALMGSVQVRRLPPPGTPRKYLGTH